MAALKPSARTEITVITIVQVVKTGADFFRRKGALDLGKEDHDRIVNYLVERWEGMSDDDITRRSLVDAITHEFQKLIDAKHIETTGAVPIIDAKLHPIEDEE